MSLVAPPTNDARFPTLMECVWSKRCIAVVGAGLSVPDYPLWPTLLANVINQCELRPEDVSSLDLLDQAEAARSKFPDKYYAALAHEFAPKKHYDCAHRYHLLARIPFRYYFTLNFDPVLIDILSMHTDVTVSEYPSLLAQNLAEREIVHLHGRITSNRPVCDTELVLSKSDFKQAYSEMSLLPSLLVQLLNANHFCFIGCDPSQEDLRQILRICDEIKGRLHGKTGPDMPQWFLLHASDKKPKPEVEDSGVLPVAFDKKTPSYQGLDDVLSHLARCTPPLIRTAGVSPYVPPSPSR